MVADGGSEVGLVVRVYLEVVDDVVDLLTPVALPRAHSADERLLLRTQRDARRLLQVVVNSREFIPMKIFTGMFQGLFSGIFQTWEFLGIN